MDLFPPRRDCRRLKHGWLQCGTRQFNRMAGGSQARGGMRASVEISMSSVLNKLSFCQMATKGSRFRRKRVAGWFGLFHSEDSIAMSLRAGITTIAVVVLL